MNINLIKDENIKNWVILYLIFLIVLATVGGWFNLPSGITAKIFTTVLFIHVFVSFIKVKMNIFPKLISLILLLGILYKTYFETPKIIDVIIWIVLGIGVIILIIKKWRGE